MTSQCLRCGNSGPCRCPQTPWRCRPPGVGFAKIQAWGLTAEEILESKIAFQCKCKEGQKLSFTSNWLSKITFTKAALFTVGKRGEKIINFKKPASFLGQALEFEPKEHTFLANFCKSFRWGCVSHEWFKFELSNLYFYLSFTSYNAYIDRVPYFH